jgi:hypothetical protein
MATTQTFDLYGLTWEVRPLSLDEQIEVECILIRTFGPAAGAAIAALVQGIAPALIEVLRDAVGEGESFDLAKLADIDTADPRLRDAWTKLSGALAETGGDIIREALTMLAGRIEHQDVLRLFELAILSQKTLVRRDGKAADVTSYKVLGELLRHNPRAKWDLLGRALSVTYSAEPEQAEEA